ncbi:HEPN domain-containing protein [Vibrio cholerae]|uniref:HEPN domain-containing protein n=1 Tax=Vibrio cholerae TaxID=666 RepID=UPI000F0B667F|nr:HEPN domain-containing protein [Vibrio cholerae]EJL6953834.1 hypothetical protein [Vibrio cholerae]RNE80299.1 hypothetical protein EEJ35_16010 [Vibrio cholerae]
MDQSKKIIKNMFAEYSENHEFLIKNAQVGFASDYKSQFSKMLLISTASYFETRITELIKEIFRSEQCTLLNNFLEKKALSRQYHTLFNWNQGASGIKQFFGYLGKDFSNFVNDIERKDEKLSNSFSDFMQIGSKRNALVHDNYATFNLDWTPEEIMTRFESALYFTDTLLDTVALYRQQTKD